MRATVGDVNPKTLENAKRQFVEVYGSALVLNTYLKIALVLVSLVALGLIGLNVYTATKYSNVKPLVVGLMRWAGPKPSPTMRPATSRSLPNCATSSHSSS